MLNQMDVPMLVQRPNGSWLNNEETKMKTGSDSVGIDIARIIKVEGIGPNGWENAVNKIIL
jgi:hypothetical protein